MARSLLLSILVLLLVCLLPAGCESGTSPGSAFVVRDSAGIEIVESSEPQLEPGSWIVSPVPVLQIGQQEGDEHYLFARVPIQGRTGMGGTFRLEDGRIVVCDGMARTVRIFDQEGRFVLQFGRSGGGPGEFRLAILSCIPHGEEIAASEGNRVSYFDTEGRFLDMTSVSTRTALSGVSADGAFLMPQTDQDSRMRAIEATAAGVYPVEATVSVASPDGEPRAWTLPVHYSRMIMTMGGAQPISTLQPFAPRLLLTVWADAFVYGWAPPTNSRCSVGMARWGGSCGGPGDPAP